MSVPSPPSRAFGNLPVQIPIAKHSESLVRSPILAPGASPLALLDVAPILELHSRLPPGARALCLPAATGLAARLLAAQQPQALEKGARQAMLRGSYGEDRMTGM